MLNQGKEFITIKQNKNLLLFMHKSIKNQRNRFFSYASAALQSIRDNCIKNQRQDIVQPTQKPLLLESSKNFRKNNTAFRSNSSKQQQKIYLNSYSLSQGCNSKGLTRQIRQSSLRSYQNFQLGTQSHIKARKNNFLSQQSITNIGNKTLVPLKQDVLTQFLKKLYFAKTKDLKIQPQSKQQKIFIRRLLNSISQTQFVAPECDFGKNSMQVIIKYISQNLKTVKINLDRNPIGDQSTIKIANLISYLKLKQLSLVSINITNRSALILLKAIQGHQTLQKLNISSPEGLNKNRINPQSIGHFKHILRNPLCKINNLNLSNIGLRQIGFLAFCSSFQKQVNLKLKNLNLSSNQIIVSGQNQKYIRSCLANLFVEKLEIQNNQIGDHGLKTFAHLLGTHYGTNQISLSLSYLDVSNNKIKSYGFQLFCNTLSSNKKLSQFHINQNNLAVNQIFYSIRHLLAHSWVIKSLYMRNTLPADPLTISHQIKSLADGIGINKSLKLLDISYNIMDVETFVNLIESLKQNKTLLVLQMEGCGIEDEHIFKAQKILKQNKTLRQINLSNNYINDQGATRLQKILAQAHNLINLNIKKNCISLHILNEIEYQLKQNKAMCQSQQDPQFLYLNYATNMQAQQKKNILCAINQLTLKTKQLNARNTALQVVQKQQQINKKQQQIKSQYNKINKLQQLINNQVKERYNISKKKQKQEEHYQDSFMVTD